MRKVLLADLRVLIAVLSFPTAASAAEANTTTNATRCDSLKNMTNFSGVSTKKAEVHYERL